MKPATTFALVFMATLTACDRIENVRIDVDHWRWERRERAFHADMDRIGKDTHQAYQLDYVVTDQWLPAFIATQPSFRAIKNGQFDMAPWLQSNGVEPTAIASAVFDPNKRKITIIDTGPNIALIEVLIEPLRPDRYRSIKLTSSPKL